MKKEIIEKINNSLLEEKKNLQERLSWFTEKDDSVKDNYRTKFPDYGNKDDENAAEVATFSDRLSMEHTLELDLKDINSALERIEKGTYGICKYCEQTIEEKRLFIRPTSSSCVSCKKKLKAEN